MSRYGSIADTGSYQLAIMPGRGTDTGEAANLLTTAVMSASSCAPPARMAGIDGGAKAGTSEVGQNAETTNGWFDAYPDQPSRRGRLVIGGEPGTDSARCVAPDALLDP